jgi:hypothetical protein
MIYDISKVILLLTASYLFLKEEPETIMGMQAIIMAMVVGLQKDVTIISTVLLKLLNVKQNMNKEQ